MKILIFIIKSSAVLVLAIGALGLLVGGLALLFAAYQSGGNVKWILGVIFTLAGLAQFFGSFAVYGGKELDNGENENAEIANH